MALKIVVGLGNPGAKYRGTRHNLGFWALEELGRRQGWPFRSEECDSRVARGSLREIEVLLAEPQTYMNASGGAVACLLETYGSGPEDLLVVCDDVALPLGMMRLRAAGSDGGHRGLRSITEVLGTESFARLRLGIGAGDEPLAEHVLAEFDSDQRALAVEAAARAAECLGTALSEGLEAAMNRYNRKPESGPPEPARGQA
ncbi:MAG TPA: aminoacyl-tRNA hydrolase [Candidatus Polarisedimenticolia bacterium]|nr:aminoacyl-tRNA hydrolase [Candidatus Polarisedimenticolia bacterium]